jgi:hypothetical protein
MVTRKHKLTLNEKYWVGDNIDVYWICWRWQTQRNAFYMTWSVTCLVVFEITKTDCFGLFCDWLPITVSQRVIVLRRFFVFVVFCGSGSPGIRSGQRSWFKNRNYRSKVRNTTAQVKGPSLLHINGHHYRSKVGNTR